MPKVQYTHFLGHISIKTSSCVYICFLFPPASIISSYIPSWPYCNLRHYFNSSYHFFLILNPQQDFYNHDFVSCFKAGMFNIFRKYLILRFCWQEIKVLLEQTWRIHWFLLLKCDYLLFFLFFYDSNLNIFEFWISDLTKQDIWWLWELVIGIFHYFLTF